jgi:hypothetical protein
VADDLIALVFIMVCWIASEPLTCWLERLAKKWRSR